MRGALKILMLFAIVAVAGTAHAQIQVVRWNYIEGGWGYLDPDSAGSENGWFAGGAVGLGKIPIHIIGEWGEYGDLDARSIGAGWHGLLGEKADLFADGSFYDADVEDGFKVRFGIRWMVTKRFEFDGNLAWLDLDFSDNLSGAVAGIFYFSKLFSVGGGYEWGDELSNARAFARFTFGDGKK